MYRLLLRDSRSPADYWTKIATLKIIKAYLKCKAIAYPTRPLRGRTTVCPHRDPERTTAEARRARGEGSMERTGGRGLGREAYGRGFPENGCHNSRFLRADEPFLGGVAGVKRRRRLAHAEYRPRKLATRACPGTRCGVARESAPIKNRLIAVGWSGRVFGDEENNNRRKGHSGRRVPGNANAVGARVADGQSGYPKARDGGWWDAEPE